MFDPVERPGTILALLLKPLIALFGVVVVGAQMVMGSAFGFLLISFGMAESYGLHMLSEVGYIEPVKVEDLTFSEFGLLAFAPVLFAFLGSRVWRNFRGPKSGDDADTSTAFGAAGWRERYASLGRLTVPKKAGKARKGGYGLPLGREQESGQIITTSEDYSGHFLTYGATRSGKGVGSVIPALLERAGSVVALDPKSELFEITQRQRKRLGSTPRALDPFGVLGDDPRRAKVNPLSLVDPSSETCVDQARRLARQIVMQEEGKMAHWSDKARNLISGLILHAASQSDRKKRSLLWVRHILTKGEDYWQSVMAEMKESTVGGGVVAGVAHMAETMEGKERASVLSNAQKSTNFLDSAAMRRHLSPSKHEGVDLRSLRSDSQTVYVIVPPDRIADYKGYLRLVIGAAVDGLYSASGSGRVLFLLDEIAQLGKMESLEDAASIIAGYGGQLWYIFQSRSQLERAYGENEKISGNCGVVQFIGTERADEKTKRLLSESCGVATVLTKGSSTTRGKSGEPTDVIHRRNKGTSENASETDRKLLFPSEAVELDSVEKKKKEMVLFEGRAKPARLEKIRYFADREFRGKYDPRPPHLVE